MKFTSGPVLFDFDGTVVDTVELIRESHRHAVKTVLERDLPDAELVALVGLPLREQMRAFSETHAAELFRVYREWNLDNTAELIQSYAGMDELLERLVATERPLAIVTSKARHVVDIALDVLPVRDYFDVIVTSDDTEVHKPEAAPVLYALEALGREPADAVVVGDSPFDLRAGQAAACRTIGVTWGFFDRETLAEENPDAIVDRVDELAATLLA